MKPIEILIQHRERIQQVFSETGSWPKTYETMKSEFSEFAGMSLATFKQYSPILIELNKQLNNQGLSMPVKQETVKHGLNIAGWNVQESGGYFRAFKKMGGKMKAVYLGKSLDDAEQKIRVKQERLSVQSEPE